MSECGKDAPDNWGKEAWRAPNLEEGDMLLFDECGRVLHHAGDTYNVDYRSHYFRLVKAQYGGTFLLVKHGGGQERVRVGYEKPTMLEGMAGLTSDQRYLLLHVMYNLASEGHREGAKAMAHKWQQAFVDGRLKKRKRPGVNSYKVWMEPEQRREAS